MSLSIASRVAFAFLVALPLLPLCGFLLDASPEMVFYLGATVFFVSVLLPICLVAVFNIPTASSLPAARGLRFTIRDLLCLTIFVLGVTLFIESAFRCEAAERASQPGPLPAAAFRQFVWEQESGLACITVAGLIWVRFALKRARS